MISLVTPSKEESLNADQLSMMRMMMNMFMAEELQIKMYGRKIQPVPDFRAELINAGGGFPAGVDRTWATNYLRQSFEHASSLPQNFEVVFKQRDYEPAPRDYLKRLGTNDPVKLKWYFGGLAPGSIFEQRSAHSYSELVRHSFSNQTYRREQLCRGTTHVAVGFVDLGILFAADLSEPPKNYEGPLHFLGIEMSAYSIAKTHILWELLKQTPSDSPLRETHLRCIMQVWYSATWAHGTMNAVKAALSVLCSSERSYHPDVRAILDHWAAASSFTVEAARTKLTTATTDSLSSVGHLLKKHDRIAMTKYELTRDFGISEDPVCGNLLMFDCPDGTPPLGNDETVFSALGFHEIMDFVRGSKRSKITIIEAAEEYAFKCIAKLAFWAQTGKVTLELKCARIQDVLDDIAARKPWTMSWSNVLDYFDYSDFHDMARKCSVHGDTIHFGYSMNWIVDVFGTNIIDF